MQVHHEKALKTSIQAVQSTSAKYVFSNWCLMPKITFLGSGN